MNWATQASSRTSVVRVRGMGDFSICRSRSTVVENRGLSVNPPLRYSTPMTEPDRRTRLLQEASALVSSAGLGAVSHRSVEQAAGAPHGSVTYWFGSREGLIAALVDWLCAGSERQVRAIAAPVQEQVAAGETLDIDAIATALIAWMDGGARLHLARMELE